MNRREFICDGLLALGFTALPGGFLFAAPLGWKPTGKPKLVIGVLSDTHLRTAVKGNRHGAHWPDKYFEAALRYFKEQEVDAVVHCGDMAHRGQTREMEFHSEAWKRVFGGVENGPVKLFVTGNHDVDGSGYGDFVKNRYPDPAERAKYVLATDMAANWGRIWGEKYEPVWHKEVKGYHFIGRNWGTSLQDIAEGLKMLPGESRAPVFYLQHQRPLAASRKMLLPLRNVLAFFGHNHWSASNWNVISLYKGNLPVVQVPSCEPRGCAALADCKEIAQMKPIKTEQTGRGPTGICRAGLRRYARHRASRVHGRRFKSRSGLGDAICLGNGERGTEKRAHPFAKDELKKVIGEPQFKRGAALEICNCENVKLCNYGNMETKEIPQFHNSIIPQSHNLTIKIPLADGNPDSRVYAYEIEVTGDEGTPKLHKAVYAAGVNMGIGHEPNGGVTTLEIPKSELPPGKELTFAVRPLSSLGTAGKAIAAKCKNEGVAEK